jgi:hypothetical protein
VRGHESNALSMDLKDTGLSASDQSGDISGAVDFEETAEFA